MSLRLNRQKERYARARLKNYVHSIFLNAACIARARGKKPIYFSYNYLRTSAYIRELAVTLAVTLGILDNCTFISI
jgi:hypothetical protein